MVQPFDQDPFVALVEEVRYDLGDVGPNNPNDTVSDVYEYNSFNEITGPHPGGWASNLSVLIRTQIQFGILPRSLLPHCPMRTINYTFWGLPSLNIVAVKFLFYLLLLYFEDRLTFSDLLSEIYDWHIRRWRLASSIGPQTYEEELVANRIFGWETPIMFPAHIPFYRRIIRYFYRGHAWFQDVILGDGRSINYYRSLL